MKQKERVYLGLGSNLGESQTLISQACHALAALHHTELLACSSLYSNPAQEVGHQPDFLNAVVLLETDLLPHILLQAILEIEHELGRQRKAGIWGQARTLDIDILLYGQLEMEERGLTIPHPKMQQRYFVLYPLAEITPDLVFPNGCELQQVLSKCPQIEMTKVNSIERIA